MARYELVWWNGSTPQRLRQNDQVAALDELHSYADRYPAGHGAVYVVGRDAAGRRRRKLLAEAGMPPVDGLVPPAPRADDLGLVELATSCPTAVTLVGRAG